MPTIKYLQKKLKYKSDNSIRQFIKSLEKKNYLNRTENNKLYINNIESPYNLKNIKIINTNKEINIYIKSNKQYIAYELNNNYFEKYHILKGDVLVIEKTKKIQNNELGLFIINKKYRIMKYFYQDGFYILKDNKEVILYKINLIGKVIEIKRKIKEV